MKDLHNATPKLFIGLDIHKRSWYVHYKTDLGDHRGYSMHPKYEELYKYVHSNFPNHAIHIAYEAGCCGFSVARKALNDGWQVVVCNPADIPRTDKQNYQKTDKIDARQLSTLLKQNLLKSVYIPTEEKEELNLLLRHRNEVTKSLRRIKVQIKAMLLFRGIEIPKEYDTPNWSIAFKTWLSQLEFSYTTGHATMDSKLRSLEFYHKEYLELANQLRSYCRKHHKQDYYLLKSIPGIGGYLASAILAELGDIRRFSNEKQFSSYIGMVPGIYESAGKDSFRGITPRCRALIRSYLVEASWVALRLDPELQAYYRKHVGKNPKSVIIKIAHKLVRRILSVIKNKQPYVCNHQLKLEEGIEKQLPKEILEIAIDE